MSNLGMIGDLPILSDSHFEAAWCRRDFIKYCETVHHGAWSAGRHHRLIAQKLEGVMNGSIKRLMIWMPPRHGKSMEVTETFPSYFLGHFPDKRVIEVSYGDELARRFGETNRAKINEFGQWLFGISISRTQGAKTNWDIAGHTGGMISVGVGGSITGKGADLLILDDPIKNREEAESITYRTRLLNEWRSTIYTRLHAGGAVVVILTRWHEADLAASLLTPENGEPEDWDVLSLPCVCDDPNDALGRKLGETLWPEHGFDEEWARRTRLAVGEYTWYSLYQQKPRPDSGAIFKREWLSKRYKQMPAGATVIQSWDLPFGKNEESAKCACFIVGRCGSNIYVEDCINDKMEFTQTIAAFRDMYAKHPEARAKVVEKAANGFAVIDYLKGEIPGLIPFIPHIGKEERARATTPYYEAGNVYFKEGSSWVEGVIEDLISFPNGKYKDTVDALTQAIMYLDTLLGAFGGMIYRDFADDPAKYMLPQDKHRAMLFNDHRALADMVTVGVSLGSPSRGAAFVATAIVGRTRRDVVVLATHHCPVHASPEHIAYELQEFLRMVNAKFGKAAEYAYFGDDESIVYKTVKNIVYRSGSPTGIRQAANTKEIDRINLTKRLISEGRFFMPEECEDLKNALLEAKWDEAKSSNARVENEISDTALLKAFEYTIEREARYLVRE